MSKVTVVVTVLMLALSVFAQDQTGSARAAAGCGAKEARFDVKTNAKQHPVPQPESSKSMIYVFQDERRDPSVTYLGQHPTTRVGLDGTWIGANHGKSYFSYVVEPGEHHLCSDWQSVFPSQLGSAVGFTAEAGKVYYFQATVEERPNRSAELKLEQIDSAQGQFLISSSSWSISQAKR